MTSTDGNPNGVDGESTGAGSGRTAPRKASGLRRAIASAAPDPAQPLVDLRGNFEKGAEQLALASVDVVATVGSPVEMEWIFPVNSDHVFDWGVIIYLHGGGFALGSRRTGRPLASWLAHHAGLPVANVGYALTPESPFGAAVGDVEHVVRWLTEHHGVQSYVLVGDSAVQPSV